MTETEIAAIDLVYEAAKAAREHAEADLEAADRLLRVASSLHDIAHAPTLRSVG